MDRFCSVISVTGPSRPIIEIIEMVHLKALSVHRLLEAVIYSVEWYVN
jgi:hypothetical protein